MNGTVGATTPSTGAFTTLTSTSASSFATSSGNVGIGAAATGISGFAANKLLEIGGASVPAIIFRPSGLTCEHTVCGAGDGLLLGATGAATASNNVIRFFTSNTNSSNTPTERARINSTGAFVFAGGTTTADGTGITFPATQSASTDANTLDDYEEGTWTPTNGGGALVVVGTFSSSGTYTKIGKVVTVAGTLNGTTSVAITGGGSTVCGGLPFSAATNTLCAGNAVNAAGTATASLYANSGTNVGSVTAMGATASIFFSITYFV
jgi:hypothetical protein